jgi:hypothetical protein
MFQNCIEVLTTTYWMGFLAILPRIELPPDSLPCALAAVGSCWPAAPADTPSDLALEAMPASFVTCASSCGVARVTVKSAVTTVMMNLPGFL